MSRTASPSTGKVYGAEMVCSAWGVPRSSFYHEISIMPQADEDAPPYFACLSMTASWMESSPFIGEGHRKVWARPALTWTRLSCSRFSSNRVRLALFVLAYNLGNFMRRFALPSEVSHWSLTSIQLKLIKIGAKIISHSRMTIFQMAEVAVPEKLFLSMLSRIHRLGRACARAPALSL